MNKNTHCRAGSTTRKRSPEGRGNPARQVRAGSRRRGAPDAPPSAPRPGRHRDYLDAQAESLLACLSQPSAEAFADPTEAGMVIVRRTTPAGVTVGAGRFSASAAQALVQNDLAAWSALHPGRTVLRLTETGLAHRRRRAAAPADSFRHQHGDLALVTVETENGPARVRLDTEESPLDWLRRRKDRDGTPPIDAAVYDAGQRRRADMARAGLLPGITARWDAHRGGPSSPAEATGRMTGARQGLRHAFDAVGAELSDVLIDLCGFLKGLELIERERRWPPRSAKVVLRLALSRLADHYGLAPLARGPAASRGIRAWQAVVIEGGLA